MIRKRIVSLLYLVFATLLIVGCGITKNSDGAIDLILSEEVIILGVKDNSTFVNGVTINVQTPEEYICYAKIDNVSFNLGEYYNTTGNHLLDITVVKSDISLSSYSIKGASDELQITLSFTIVDSNDPSLFDAPNLASEDDLGNSSTDNITAQTSGLSIRGVTLPGTALKLYANDIEVGSTTVNVNGNWELNVDLSDGEYEITYSVEDSSGGLTYGKSLAVTIDSTIPQITGVQNNGYYEDGVTISITQEQYISHNILINNDTFVPGQYYTTNGQHLLTYDLLNTRTGAQNLNQEINFEVNSEFRVNSTTENSQTSGMAAALSNDDYVIVWIANSDIYAQRFHSNGVTIGEEFRVNTHTTGTQSKPVIAPLSNGGFVIVYESWAFDGHEYAIAAQIYDSDGNTVGEELLANTTTDGFELQPEVAALPTGGFVVTWRVKLYSGSFMFEVVHQLFDNNGNKIGPEKRVNSHIGNYQDTPAIAAFSDGQYVIAWESFYQILYEDIFMQHFSPTGNMLGSETQVNTYVTDYQMAPDVVVLSNDNYVVVWSDNDPYPRASFQLYKKDNTPIGSWKKTPDTYIYGGHKDTVATDDGGFMIYADHIVHRYDSQGNLLQFEYLRSTDYYSPFETRMTRLTDGSILVVRSGIPIDGDESGISCKRYNADWLK